MLALCIISEGDHPNLKRAVKSVYKYVDHIFITTTKINKPQWEDPKISWSFFPWNHDFSAARNFNLKQVPKDFTHILWIDSDDVVETANVIPEVVEAMNEKGIDAVYVDYNYEIDSRGNVVIVHPRERIVRNGIYHWKAKLHETLIPNRRVANTFIKDFAVNHYPTKENKRDGLLRNLKILQKDYETQRKKMVGGEIEEIDPRTEYYLGRVLYDTKTDTGLKKAFNLFQDYLGHSGWDEEKAFAWNYLGNIDYHFQKYEDSLICYLSAIKERPEFPTWHINLARSYAALKDFDKAEHHLNVALGMQQPKTSMILTPFEDRRSVLLVSFFVNFNKKDFKKSIKSATMLYDLEPTRENARRVESVEKLQQWTNWMKSVTEMVKTLDDEGEIEKISNLINGLPKDVEHTVYADYIRHEYQKPVIWPDKSIAYYAAIDVHEWSPKSLKTGLGGSEEAIVYLAKEWVKLGYKVTVFTNVGANEGVYDGVEYVNYQRFNAKDKFDIVISWRNPNFIRKNLIDCRLMLLDMHDVPEVGEFDDDLLARVDYIMVKSDYHRSLLSKIPGDKFVIINNGIDWKQLNKVKAKKDPHACFYGSSPDRGLDNVLEIWPKVREQVPDATLHICYGFELYKKLLGHVAHKMRWMDYVMKLTKQPGVIYHGKVGKKELYKIAKSCGVWVYPTYFEEIDCITARYCQALGTVPVVYDYAALKTTVQRGVQLAVDPKNKKSLKEYLPALVSVLKKPITFDNEFAKEWDWSVVANRWVEIFNRPAKQEVMVTVYTPTIRSGFWNLMAENLSKQTYKNFEWLIIDDYPEDRRDIAAKYASKYQLNIRYLRGKKERKLRKYALVQANNTAMYEARGQLLFWLQDFILIPPNTLERMVSIHRRHPKDLIAPVDTYYHMSVKPNLDHKEDWFDGKTDIVGKLQRKNIRLKRECVRYSMNPYDFELNVGAIPTKILRLLNGFWEFMDDGLGYDNTEIAIRAQKIGCGIIIDERSVAMCLDLWEWLGGKDENIPRREWAINPPRFLFLYNMMKLGKLPIVRNSNIDRKISLQFPDPGEMSAEKFTMWMHNHAPEIAKKWMEEWK